MKALLVVYQCPQHPRMFSLVLERADGGTRLSESKCCPYQYGKTITEWSITPNLKRAVIEELGDLVETDER